MTTDFNSLQARVKEIMVLGATGVLIGNHIKELAVTLTNTPEPFRLRAAIDQTKEEAMKFVAFIINAGE